MDRTGIEFNMSFVSLQNKNSSHCHLDIIHLLFKLVFRFVFLVFFFLRIFSTFFETF